MSERFQRIHKIVLKYEGGYVNHPSDPGGATYKGISRTAHPNWAGWKYVDMGKQPPEALVTELYHEGYWKPLRADELPMGIGEYLYDFGVNAGIIRAVSLLQQALKVKVDGVVGPQTISEARKIDPNKLLQDLFTLRLKYYVSITLSNKNFNIFFLGWIRRTIEVYEVVKGWI